MRLKKFSSVSNLNTLAKQLVCLIRSNDDKGSEATGRHIFNIHLTTEKIRKAFSRLVLTKQFLDINVKKMEVIFSFIGGFFF